MRRCQAEGGLHPDRDVDAEAWIFLAVGVLATFAQRLGGVLGERDLQAIRQSRLRWLVPEAV